MKNIMQIDKKCCGCGACVQSCPQKCIQMYFDKEGFLTPKVDIQKCISCSLCLKICPALNPPKGHKPFYTLAAYTKDEDSRFQSSSGGMFTVAAREVIRTGGMVCAVILDETTREAIFDYAYDEGKLESMRGSKYVQANTKECFKQIQECLNHRKRVLFVGCPCQVAALHNFLQGKEEGLITIDIICHGVPSPQLFQAYLKMLDKKEKAVVEKYYFRSKTHGWGMSFAYQTSHKKRLHRSLFDPYNFNFLRCRTYRESCYQCLFACQQRQGDWTIGDYWGIIREHPEFYSEGGVSALIVNTEKGKKLFEKVQGEIVYQESSFERVARHNQNLIRPSSRPSQRDGIYQGMDVLPPVQYIKKRLKVRPTAKEVIKALIPWQVKRFYQRRKEK